MDLSRLNDIISNAGYSDAGEDVSDCVEFMTLENDLSSGQAGLIDAESEHIERDWEDVSQRCISLLERSKNLWVAVFLTYSLTKTDKFNGLKMGLELIKSYLEFSWATVYPELDKEEEDAPFERINALSLLSPEPGAQFGLVDFSEAAKNIQLSNSRQLGSFSYQQYQQALANQSGEVSAIEASILDTPQEAISDLVTVLNSISNLLTDICEVFAEKTSNQYQLNYSRFKSEIDDISKFLCKYSTVISEERASEVEGEVFDTSTPNSTGNPRQNKPIEGEINSAEDAVQMLNKVCDYFEKNEPSSPVPLLIKRAIKLISMNFNDIIQDICPEAIRQIEWLIPNEES